MDSIFYDWLNKEEWLDEEEAGKLSEKEISVVTSQGLLIDELSVGALKSVKAELIWTEPSTLSIEDSEYMNEDEGLECLVREVWLCVDGEKMVYAKLLIPVSRVDEKLLMRLKKDEEPLGGMLRAMGADTEKEKFQYGHCKGLDVSKGLSGDGDEKFITRRYLLSSRKGNSETSEWIIKAMVIEVFSREIAMPFPGK
ncbi:MAG: chorismate lyase [Deltaproteobacteria bacterium]|nr:chorismate lyase [Deltaproteobacteria bacterium]